ncbi:UPF0481 protein At3g47200 [Ziziphus jujuba]|uniref:UPF0481 protein At3g47200 n=1 Tax=Ziziphus jujuba TaxID=326968 RepID=A0A9B4ET88_ZIZJJ|nr:UPF0481 protein At3g47200 [Ziziphus jujuba]XP_015903077.3 UPF0481 protein At3g47200 [Ziziphus jujuba]XP_060673017.1 UPF0481 protein At3g47200 [Ziziphus jujuba]XP_060673018.1 UPF0481 protein At3g47200 [Ziziphus jujuba]
MESGNGFDPENPYISLANSIKIQFKSLPPISSACTICRVPDRLRLANEKAYTPQVVSIGPFHHGKDSLKTMEEHKMRYLEDYLQRTDESLENYIKIVKESEPRLRSCYAETIGFSSDEFVKIILVDSVFIIQVLLRFSIRELRVERDPIFNRRWMLHDVWPDLCLLENQLPFFILEKIYEPNKIKLSSGQTVDLSIIELSHKFFTKLMQLEGIEEKLEEIKRYNVAHVADFLRNLYIPSNLRDGGEFQSINAPSVTELHRAGVKFRVASSKNLFDISFNNGILEIPKLRIDDYSELIIRNLLAFEQCHYDDNYMNDYVAIMDRLVNIPKDVDLLVEHEILENWLGDSGEVATLINKLAEGATWSKDDFYFADTFNNLNVYCRTRWHKWKANLKQNYFNTPWAIVSVIAAIFLIILAIIQTVCSILQVEK